MDSLLNGTRSWSCPALPGEQTRRQFRTMAGRIHPVPWQGKVLPDRTRSAQECLRALRVAKATHLALTCARRLMTILRPVVQPRSGFHEYMLHPGEFRNFRLRRRITSQLVSHDRARHGCRTQHPFEEAFCRRLVTALL